MKRTLLLTECAAFSAVLLFSMAGCSAPDKPEEDTLPVFAPVESASNDVPPPDDDPLALMLPHATVVYDVPPLPLSLSLTQIGTVSDPEHRIGFYEDGTLREYVRIDGIDKYYFLTYDGRRASDSPYLGITPVTETVFAVTADKSTVNRVGLIASDGTLLLPCEAAAVIPLESRADKAAEPRFAEVIFAEERAKDGDDAFFARSDGLTFTGYALIYDLSLRRYVPNLRITGSASRLPAVSSDRIAVSDVSTGSTVLYTPDGTPAATFSRLDMQTLGRDSYLAASDGEYRLYEYDSTATYVSDRPLAVIEGEGRYYTEETDGGVYVIDRFGNRLFDEAFGSVVQEHGGVLHAVKADGTHVLADLSGKHLYETSDGEPKHLSRGIYLCGDTVILPDGSTAEVPSGEPGKLLFNDKESNAYCFGAHDFTLGAEQAHAVGEALAAIRDGEEYVLYELFGGKELLHGGYGIIAEAYGYLYARRGGSVDVFVCREEEPAENVQSLQNGNTN